MTEPDWGHFRAFLAVLRDGTLSGAARELGLTQPTLGRQIAELERRLGTALFVRSQRGLVPTDAARDIAPHAETMAAAAGSMMRAASGGAGDAAGVVRITASEIIGAEVLPSLLPDSAAPIRASRLNWCCPTAWKTCCAARPTSPFAWCARASRRWWRGRSVRCASDYMPTGFI